MDVSALRTEIKAWERQFKAQNGREPTVKDIKNTPSMPDKYKLYKKLSKQNASSSSAPRPVLIDRPSTPPKSPQRQRPSAASIVSKPRAVKTEPPVLTDNPFSPVKDKAKQRALFSHSIPIASSSRANPFTTPRKAQQRPRVTRRDPSPDPFPLIQPPQTPSSHSSSSPLQQNPSTPAHHDPSTPVHHNPAHRYKDTAITRARKRLRGEPVSPSPVKEKRARVVSQSSLVLPRHSTLVHTNISGDEDADHATEEAQVDAQDALFFNSPVKRPADGKQFKLLFDEALVTQDIPARPPRHPLPATKSGPFGNEPKEGKQKARAFSPDVDDGLDWDDARGGGKRIKALDLSLDVKPEKRKPFKNGFSRAALPGKDDLWDATRLTSVKGAQTGPPNSDSRTTGKRPLSWNNMAGEAPDLERDTSRPQLLPPSPPPPDAKSSSRYADKGKGKGIPAGSRKKAKLLEQLGSDDEDVEDKSEGENVHVKELSWSWNAHTMHTTAAEGVIPIDRTVGADSGSEFDSTSYRRAPAAAPLDSTISGNFEVDLPEDLRRVLALSSQPLQKQELEEERLARELLYSRRETHYNPNRGGEIWDVGELSDEVGEERTKKALSDEDEWEGEPIPWEVGEL